MRAKPTPLINLALAGQIAQMLTNMGLTLVESPLQGQPRYLGASTDKRTQLELLGALGQLRGITVVASVDPDDLPAARRNGELMRLLLDLVAPLWRGRGAWLLTGLKRFDQARPKLEKDPRRYKAVPLTATLGYANLSLTYLHKTNQVILKIAMRGAYVAIATS